MVDNMNPDPMAPAETVPSSSSSGFFSSTLGKAIVIAGGLAVVLGLLAAVGLFVLGNGLFSAAKNTVANAPSAAAPSSTPASPTTEDVAEQRQAEPVTDVFTFRNPFVPTVKPAVASTETTTTTTGSGSSSSGSGTGSSGSGSGSGSGSASVPADTLALTGITREDGSLVGTFLWNGTTFHAGEGDTLEGTPWKVVNLTSSTATMLYGDSEVTLSVGQGISK